MDARIEFYFPAIETSHRLSRLQCATTSRGTRRFPIADELPLRPEAPSATILRRPTESTPPRVCAPTRRVDSFPHHSAVVRERLFDHPPKAGEILRCVHRRAARRWT